MARESSSTSSKQDMPPPGVNASFYFMDKARQKYRANPQLVEPIRLPKKIPTPEELDYDERLDRALASSNRMLQEANEQLAKPCVAPEKLTPSEQAETDNAEAWMRGYDITNRTNDAWLEDNQRHYDEVMALIDELEAGRIPISANLEVPPEPKSPSIDQLPIPDQAKHWLKGSWNFREYRDADFVAAQKAEQNVLHRPWVADPTSHGRASSEPPTARDIWKGAESLGGALQGKLARSSLSIRHRVTSSVGAVAWQNVFKVDKTVKW